MKLVALCGLHGAGKDTVADALPARKIAFADVLYREVAEAFDFMVPDLKCRETKEVALRSLRLTRCWYDGFLEFNGSEDWEAPRSPRHILQAWGDYRRSQDPDYFVKRTNAEIIEWNWAECGRGSLVISDCRYPNEAAMVRNLGGQIWQVVRPWHQPPMSGHSSEVDGSAFSPDVVLINDRSTSHLTALARAEWGLAFPTEACA